MVNKPSRVKTVATLWSLQEALKFHIRISSIDYGAAHKAQPHETNITRMRSGISQLYFKNNQLILKILKRGICVLFLSYNC